MKFSESFINHLCSDVEILRDMPLFIVLVTVEDDQPLSKSWNAPGRDAALGERVSFVFWISLHKMVFELDEGWIKGRKVIVSIRGDTDP